MDSCFGKFCMVKDRKSGMDIKTTVISTLFVAELALFTVLNRMDSCSN